MLKHYGVFFGSKIKLYSTSAYVVVLCSNYDVLSAASKGGFIKLSLTKRVLKDLMLRLHRIYYFDLKQHY